MCKYIAHLVTTSLLALAACNSAGSGPAPLQPPDLGSQYSSKLMGVSILTPTTSGSGTTVFLGYRKDLLQQMQESLSGVEKDELWYRVQLPTASMPTRSTEKTLDLAQPGIDIAIRKIIPIGKPSTFQTLVFHSGLPTVEGDLTLTGADLVAKAKANEGISLDGQPWGIVLKLKYHGPLTVGTTTIPDGNMEITVGALVLVTP